MFNKFFTLSVSAFIALVFTGGLFAQDFSTNPNPSSETYGQIQYTPTAATTITHSATQNIVAGSASCNDGTNHTDNSYWRSFVLADFGITDDFNVTTVEIGVETATGAGGTQPITVNLYTTDAPFPGGTLTLIGTASVVVADQTLSIFPSAVTGTAPAGSELVVEIFTPEGQTDGNTFFIGSNPDGQTAPSYISAAACGITTPTDVTDIGFPDMMIVMNVTGDVVPSTTFSDDFESYTIGGQLACQNPTNWSTWNNLPCDPTEDAYISDSYAYSGTNSFVIVQDNDVIKPLGTQTSGKWDIGLMVYIPAGKGGYFNCLSDFFGSPQDWAMHAFFTPGGAGELYAGSPTIIPFTYLHDVWQLVRIVVNLDSDLAQFFVEGVLIHSWQWTLGEIGAGGPLQLDAIDFFGFGPGDEIYYDDFMFGEYPFVPVELTSFTANVNNKGNVILNWNTATELNNQMFEIERRSDEGQYLMIGYVNGHGTTTEPQEYSYIDITVETGTYFYRLKQIDFLGTYEYSDEIEVEVKGPLTFGLEQNYPNPFNPSTNIKYRVSETGSVKLSIYSVIGEEVAVLVDGIVQAGFYDVTFDASNLPSGAYFYRLQSDNLNQVKKMLLMK